LVKPKSSRNSSLFCTRAEFWLNLQGLYDLRLAQDKGGKSIQAIPTLKTKRSRPRRRKLRAEGNDGVDIADGDAAPQQSSGTGF
jgi:hypothetical protein